MNISNIKKKVYILIERILAKLCWKIIAISEKEKESAIENKICNPDKINVIFNGIDIEEYESNNFEKFEVRKKLNIPNDSLVFGMVGRISEQKSPDIFIKFAERIKKDIPNSKFLIVGDGEDREKIESLISELKLNDSVIITGWVDNIYEYVKTFDIAMLLSRWEGFGLAIAEYMVCEVPIIASNVDAIPNIIQNGVDGVLVNLDNIDDIIDGVKKILNNENFKKKIVVNSKEKVVKLFNIKRVAEEHEKFFDNIVNKLN